jgi:cyanophycin synthetase
MVDGKLAAAAKRTPAHVVGDGTSSVQQLIDEVNSDPKRGDGHENVLTKIRQGLKQHSFYPVKTIPSKPY